MGLVITRTLDSGLQVNNAYARIGGLSGDKAGLDITLNYYVDQQSFTDGKSYAKQEFYHFVPSQDDNSLRWDKQGYTYLKTLSNFDGAVDA